MRFSVRALGRCRCRRCAVSRSVLGLLLRPPSAEAGVRWQYDLPQVLLLLLGLYELVPTVGEVRRLLRNVLLGNVLPALVLGADELLEGLFKK